MANDFQMTCDIDGCRFFTQMAAIVGNYKFCTIPAQNAVDVSRQFLKMNICDVHLDDVRRNFAEVYFDADTMDYRTILKSEPPALRGTVKTLV